ncbi:MAG: transcription antitermination factor NusB [Thermodesulfobacteriota bacterium]
MGLRHKSREIALTALYQAEMSGNPVLEGFPLLCDTFEVNQKAVPYARELVEGIAGRWEELNGRIGERAQNWRLSRMSVLDRNIIRIAAYEMLFRDDVPPRVAIDEAIELAKRFCTDDSPSFINGILDAILKSLPAGGQADAGGTTTTGSGIGGRE